jgi:hypothetical protein
LLHAAGEGVALGVNLHEVFGRRHAAQRGDELFEHELRDGLRVDGFVAERARRVQNRVHFGLHLDVELGFHIHAQVIAGNERVGSLALHLQFHRLQRDGHEGMQVREHQCAAVQHHAPSPEPSPHIRHVRRRAHIELGDHQEDEPDDQQ